MHLEEKIRGEVAIVALDGELLDENDAFKVHQKISSLLTDGFKKIVFDLQNLHRINQRGLDTLTMVFQIMRDRGGDIRLAEIDRQIDNIFVKTRLARFFSTYETVGRALASYME